MAIDPKKLEAFAKGGKQDAGGGAPPGGGGPPGGNPGGGKPGKDEGEGEKHEEEEAGEGGEGRFGKFQPLLEKFHEDVEACCDELDPELLSDTSLEIAPEDAQILKEGFEDLDEEFVTAARDALSGGISMDEAHEMAAHLDSEGLVENPDRVAGWLFRVAQTL